MRYAVFACVPMISANWPEIESLTWGSVRATNQGKLAILMLNFNRPFSSLFILLKEWMLPWTRTWADTKPFTILLAVIF